MTDKFHGVNFCSRKYSYRATQGIKSSYNYVIWLQGPRRAIPAGCLCDKCNEIFVYLGFTTCQERVIQKKISETIKLQGPKLVIIRLKIRKPSHHAIESKTLLLFFSRFFFLI